MTPETGGPEKAGGSPTRAGYVIGAVMAVLIVAGIYFALTAGGNAEPGNAHLATPSSGSSNGVQPDERVGTRVATGSFDLKSTSQAAGCVVKLDLPNEGSDHLNRDDPVPDYKTSPPTSGDHIGPPLQQADGAYSETPRPQDVVHSLEHGRIAIQYDPDLPEKDQLELKGLYDSAYSGALLYPNPDMPYAVAATAWTSLIGCPEWQGAKTIDAIRAFGIANQGKAPESIDIFPPLEGPKFMNLRKP
ncbi:MAG: DUF3105 domain-containing protein [Solirubrobacterales bacterium]|nr:DUF3105 domain-containing protein [Solirubrobacterales bacterium]